MTTNARKHKEELSSKKKNIFLQIFPLGLENGETLDELCFKFLSIFPALPSPSWLSQRQKLLSTNSQMLKVFKTFVATVALSQKIILLLDEVPSLQLSPSLSHWNIGKLGRRRAALVCEWWGV